MPDNRRVTDAPRRLRQAWRTLDFKPATPGWRVVYLDPDKRAVLQVPGWLIQESYFYDLPDDQAHDDDAPERRVIPGVCVLLGASTMDGRAD